MQSLPEYKENQLSNSQNEENAMDWIFKNFVISSWIPIETDQDSGMAW